MDAYHCNNCKRPYPDSDLPHRCLHCGGIFTVSKELNLAEDDQTQSGIWRYENSFGLSPDTEKVSLGEGDTPLVRSDLFGKEIYFKLEYQNPTGSFKDRGSAALVSEMKSRGVVRAVDDSSGNAGASFAAYAARAGIEAKVLVPENTSGPKRAQIEAYGAEIEEAPGPRSAAADRISEVIQEGVAYASHAFLPFGLAGLATIAYEIFDELGQAPGTVVAPAGHGSLLLGIALGFEALKAAGKIEQLPKLVAVQASACAPLWVVTNIGPSGLGAVQEGPTLAEGVRVRIPIRGDELILKLRDGKGHIHIVEEDRILPGRNALAKLGFYVEPTSAIVWDTLEQMQGEISEPVVVILTGSGLKNTTNN